MGGILFSDITFYTNVGLNLKLVKGNTWLPHESIGMVESFISLYLDKHFHLKESNIKNFDRNKKSKPIYDAAVRLSSAIKV